MIILLYWYVRYDRYINESIIYYNILNALIVCDRVRRIQPTILNGRLRKITECSFYSLSCFVFLTFPRNNTRKSFDVALETFKSFCFCVILSYQQLAMDQICFSIRRHHHPLTYAYTMTFSETTESRSIIRTSRVTADDLMTHFHNLLIFSFFLLFFYPPRKDITRAKQIQLQCSISLIIGIQSDQPKIGRVQI